MSDYTRAELIAQAEDEAEATGSARWSADFKKRRLDWVFAREWRKILAANPTYRLALRQVVPDAGGLVPLASLDLDAGDDSERFAKVLHVANGTVVYEPRDFRDHPLLGSLGSGEPAYWFQGDALAVPESDSGQTLSVWVNHTPQKPSALAGDDSLVVFPRDYSGVLVHGLAAELLAKGNTESDLALEQKALADEIRREMFDEITRRSTTPMFVSPVDLASDWGAR